MAISPVHPSPRPRRSGGCGETLFDLDAGLGVTGPRQDRLAWRFEAALGYAIETYALRGGPTLGLLAGPSFLTR